MKNPPPTNNPDVPKPTGPDTQMNDNPKALKGKTPGGPPGG